MVSLCHPWLWPLSLWACPPSGPGCGFGPCRQPRLFPAPSCRFVSPGFCVATGFLFFPVSGSSRGSLVSEKSSFGAADSCTKEVCTGVQTKTWAAVTARDGISNVSLPPFHIYAFGTTKRMILWVDSYTSAGGVIALQKAVSFPDDLSRVTAWD